MIRRAVEKAIAAAVLLAAGMGLGQTLPESEIAASSFISHELGASSVLLNPAGLNAFPQDDGVMVYDFVDEEGRHRQFAFALSMGSLGFGVQQFRWEDLGDYPFLRIYRANLSVGGRVLSIGTSNKLYHLEYPHHFTRSFSVDAGIHFQPIKYLQFAGLALDCNEPEVAEYLIGRRYLLGAAIVLFDRALYLQQQIELTDDTRHLEDVNYQLGVVLRPWGRLEFAVGYKKNIFNEENYMARIKVPLPIGLEVTVFARGDEKLHAKVFAAALLLPIQPLRF